MPGKDLSENWEASTWQYDGRTSRDLRAHLNGACSDEGFVTDARDHNIRPTAVCFVVVNSFQKHVGALIKYQRCDVNRSERCYRRRVISWSELSAVASFGHMLANALL